MLMPKKVKHRKMHKGKARGLRMATSGEKVSYGSFGLQSQEFGWITSRQIESARRTITRYIQRKGKIWIRIFPDKSVTAKAAEVPMGQGKGAVDHYVAVIKPGRVLFEMDGVEEKVAREALHLAGYKLPVITKFVSKQ